MNNHRIFAVLLGALVLSACEKNAVQVLPTADLAGARIKFFNFGVGAPGVNFYADETKMTAIVSGTGVESNSGVAYGSAAAGGVYTAIEPDQYTLTGRIAAATDKNLPIATVTTTIEDGKYYSLYMSGFYNSTTKTVDAFVVEDPVVPPPDFATASLRFVHVIGNANPMTLYAANVITNDTVVVGGAMAYKGVGAFVSLPQGIYTLFTRYTGSTTAVITRADVPFVGGRVYTITARGDITITSTTAATRPILDQTANR